MKSVFNESCRNITENLTPIDYTYQFFVPYIFLILSSFFLNGIVLIIAIIFIKKKTFSIILFGSSGLANFMSGTVSISFKTIKTELTYWPFSKFLCNLWIINDYSSSTLGIYSVLIICAHRIYQLKQPFKSDEKTTKMNIFLIIFMWIFIYSFWTITVFSISNDNPFKNCNFTYKFEFIIIVDFLAFVGPILLIFLINILIVVEIKKN